MHLHLAWRFTCQHVSILETKRRAPHSGHWSISSFGVSPALISSSSHPDYRDCSQFSRRLAVLSEDDAVVDSELLNVDMNHSLTALNWPGLPVLRELILRTVTAERYHSSSARQLSRLTPFFQSYMEFGIRREETTLSLRTSDSRYARHTAGRDHRLHDGEYLVFLSNAYED